MADVLVLTLLGGQDVIGEVSILTESYWVKKPMAVIMQQKPGGQVGLGLAPFPPLANPEVVKKNGVHINRSLVVTVNPPVPDLLQGYTQTVSGLVVPQQPKILITEGV